MLLGTPLSGCFRLKAVGLLKLSAGIPQSLRKHVMSHTTQNTYAKTWHFLSRILRRFYKYIFSRNLSEVT